MLSFDGTGAAQFDRIGGLLLYEQCLASDSLELFHQDYSYKAVKTLVPARADGHEAGPGAADDPGALRVAARPGPLLRARRPVPELVDAAARPAHRRGARRAGAGDGAGGRGHGPRGRGPLGGRRRRHQLRHRRRRRRRRPAGDPARGRDAARAPPRHGHHGRHGGRARARHARRARVPRHAGRRAVAGGPAEAGRAGRGDDLRPGGQRQHGSQPRLEHEPRPGARQALHGRARASPCT